MKGSTVSHGSLLGHSYLEPSRHALKKPGYMESQFWLRFQMISSTNPPAYNLARLDVNPLARSQIYSSCHHVQHHVVMPSSAQIEDV